MQLYDRGIRRRLAPMLDGDRRRLELAYSLMFTLPGHAGAPLRRRDRHGRRPDAARAQLRAHADAVVDGAARRLHQGDKPHPAGDQRAAPTATSTSTSRSSAATRTRCSTGPSASSACARRCRRSAGAISRSSTRRPRRAGHALRLAQQLGAVPAQSRGQARGRSRSPPACSDAEGRRCWSTCWPTTTATPTKDGKHRSAARGLRLSLVPRRRPRLPAEAQRDRDARAGLSGDRRVDRMSLVADRGDVPDLPTLVPGQRRRTASAICAASRQRLPYLQRAGRRRHLDLAHLPLADGRFRLRHLRLHRDRSAVRHAGGVRCAAGGRPRARSQGPARSGAEPHLRPASLVPGEPLLADKREARLVYLARSGAGRRARRTTGCRHSAAARGSGTSAPASTTITRSWPRSPISTGATRQCARRFTTSCASGFVAGSTGSAWT